MAIDAVSHSIQLAVAPVFMLTAIAAMIGALATRLGRIIDRDRTLEERLELLSALHEVHMRDELSRLRKRGHIFRIFRNSAAVTMRVAPTRLSDSNPRRSPVTM